MIKAASLVYALFVITIVSMICFTFVLAVYYHQIRLVNTSVKLKQLSYVKSGMILLRGGYRSDEIFIEEKQLFEEDTFSKVLLQRSSWGAFELLRCETRWKNNFFGKSIIIGQSFRGNDEFALYLADRNRSLSLSGETLIKGLVYLPEAGVKRAFVEGENFKGSTLIHGDIKKSENKLPNFNPVLLERLLAQSKEIENFFDDSTISLSQLKAHDSLNWGFSQKTLVLETKGDLFMDEVKASGNIVVRSTGTISISGKCRLENIILFGKNIIIQDGFEGSIQAFARDTVKVRNGCRLNYPTVLGTIGKADFGTQLILVSDNSVIEGALIQDREEVSLRDTSIIKIEKDAKVVGQIYGRDKIYLKGKVAGSIICKAFVMSTTSSIYDNYILNAEIDLSARPKDYVGIPWIRKKNVLHNEIVSELQL